MNYKEIKVENLTEKTNVYQFLKLQGYSEHYIKNLRKKIGYILVNNINSTTRTPLNNNDILKIETNPFPASNIKHCDIPLDIIYEDEDYLIVNKPSNLSCIPTSAHIENNLGGAICKYMSTKCDNFILRFVGRLDKDTSGIVIVAKNSIACQKLEKIEKTYSIICIGNIYKNIIIEKPILTITNNGKNEMKRIISENGKYAKTYVYPIKQFNNFTLCNIKIIQGRTHQIRLHLSSINHPLLGDSLYGTPHPDFTHSALVCKKISFYHYNKETYINLEIPLPKDFEQFITNNSKE